MIVEIDAGGAWLEGDLVEPASAHGMIVFAQRSDRFLVERLNRRGLATLVVDLALAEPDRDDVGLLAARLAAACDHVQEESNMRALPVGLFGESTGAAAAIVVAARRPAGIAAVVSSGGRPDLAGRSLDRIQAPTLLIVGRDDFPVIEYNEAALARLEHVASRLEIEGDPAELAGDWFDRYLPRYRPAYRTLSGVRPGRVRP